MLKKAVVFLVALSFAASVRAGGYEDLLEEIRELRARIAELEQRVAQLQSQQQSEAERSRLQQELRAVSEALKGIEIGFSSSGLLLGTVGNDENDRIEPRDLREDRVDAGLKVSLELSKEVLEGGTLTVVLEGQQGGRTSERVPSWWGLEDIIGEYVDEPDLELSEVSYQQEFSNCFSLTLGKIDMGSFFDSNRYAGDEVSQFLSPGFVHSVAIDFPDSGPGLVGSWHPSGGLYLLMGLADSDWSGIGRKPFIMAEAGFGVTVKGLEGSYRLYGWWQKKRRDEATGWDGSKEDGWGVGMSLDQELAEGVGGFLRVGYQNEDLYEFSWAWSLGFEIGGMHWGRDEDALGLAFGMAHLSDEYEDYCAQRGETWIEEDEGHLEAYYRFQVSEHLHLSPDLQVLWNAQGDERFDPVLVLGLRGHLEL